MSFNRDIRQIKLMNGEEILTEVLGEDTNEMLIRKPLRVMRERVSNGVVAREANMFTKWMSFTDNDEFFIPKASILVEGLANEIVAMYYHRMMSSIDADQGEDMELHETAAEAEARMAADGDDTYNTTEEINRALEKLEEKYADIIADAAKDKKVTFH